MASSFYRPANPQGHQRKTKGGAIYKITPQSAARTPILPETGAGIERLYSLQWSPAKYQRAGSLLANL